jgi:hypothetical protein
MIGWWWRGWQPGGTYGFNMQPRNMMGIWYSLHWWSFEFVTYEDRRRLLEKVPESFCKWNEQFLLYYNQAVQRIDENKHWPGAISYWLPSWWHFFLSNLNWILFSLFLNAIIFITCTIFIANLFLLWHVLVIMEESSLTFYLSILLQAITKDIQCFSHNGGV